ncbi:uncharacterized protein LOC136071569 [Quercus suber]|uniref:uncharacterized protein LOC136071569 n=1 Tax=Quercus suber TaxID=58331 RepID=UPI0032DE44C3
MTGEYKIDLPLNAEGQPIGEDGSLFIRWLGSFCENGMLFPLTFVDWPSIPQKFKQDYWVEIEKRYIINPNIVAQPNQMRWAMHQLGELRRNRRTKLKKDHKKQGLTRQQVLASKLYEVITEQCAEMVDYWFNEKTEIKSNKNKESRGKQEDIARSGAKSLAQISNQMAKPKGVAVEHVDVYQRVYRTKDGVVVSARVQDNMVIRLQGEIDNGILWSNDDAYAWVMGRLRHPRRVCGVGFGITPSGRSGTIYSQSTSIPSISRAHQRMSELEMNHEELREQLAQSREELAKHREEVSQSEARHREELAQSEARHQAEMANLKASMRSMFKELSQEFRTLYPSQDHNA